MLPFVYVCVCMCLSAYSSDVCDSSYICRICVRLSVHPSHVCMPLRTSVGCLCAFLYISCKQFPFLSLRFPCYITYQNIFNKFLSNYATDCGLPPYGKCSFFSLFFYVAVNVEQTKKMF